MKITDVTVQKKNKNRVSVYADGEYAFSLDGADALRLGVKIGAEITEADIKAYNIESNLSKAKAKAFDIVSRKSVTRKQMYEKLSEKGYDSDICDEVIKILSEYNYINDAAYAEDFIEYGVSKGWGRIKISFELERRGVEKSLISTALADLDDSPEDRIYDILSVRFADVDMTDLKQKQRAVRFFASRGFEFESIKSAISKFCDK